MTRGPLGDFRGSGVNIFILITMILICIWKKNQLAQTRDCNISVLEWGQGEHQTFQSAFIWRTMSSNIWDGIWSDKSHKGHSHSPLVPQPSWQESGQVLPASASLLWRVQMSPRCLCELLKVKTARGPFWHIMTSLEPWLFRQPMCSLHLHRHSDPSVISRLPISFSQPVVLYIQLQLQVPQSESAPLFPRGLWPPYTSEKPSGWWSLKVMSFWLSNPLELQRQHRPNLSEDRQFLLFLFCH